MLRLLILALAFVLIAPAGPAEAGAKRHKRVAKPVAAQTIPGFQHRPARMIEIRPGYWISSHGCFTDDGYGRIGPCDGRDSTD
jgi:hypothetical protein